MDENKLIVVYETMEKKEILRNIIVFFIPRKGDHINFKGVSTDLPEWQKEKIHQVEEVEFKLPGVVVIRVYSI